MLFML
jgi:hypothetical protein